MRLDYTMLSNGTCRQRIPKRKNADYRNSQSVPVHTFIADTVSTKLQSVLDSTLCKT